MLCKARTEKIPAARSTCALPNVRDAPDNISVIDELHSAAINAQSD
jgi:hypothetical protein